MQLSPVIFLQLTGAAGSCGQPGPHGLVVLMDIECSNSVKKGSQGAIMLLCPYARFVRSGVVCSGLPEKEDRQVWNGEDNALCLPCILWRSGVRTSLR